MCPEENTWQRYVGGALGSARDLELHLDHCAECRVIYANVAHRSTLLGIGTGPTAKQDATVSTMPVGSEPTMRALPSSTNELARGSLVDRYVVLGTLGRGGMGVVYKAFDPQLDRPVALKLVVVPDAHEAKARLVREAKTLAQLSHPNVVGVHDAGAHEDDVFVAMEFVAGENLRRWLDRERRAPREVLPVFLAAGTGLAAAHRQGIVHRDFKPENVIVGDDGRVRVLDFGLARPSAPNRRPSVASLAPASDDDLTRVGAIMGTPSYMAPEQDLGADVDHRSDQFSFCASLFEALFGRRPFGGGTYDELAANRAAGELRPAPSVRGVTARVRRAVLRGLRTDPAERHGSMDALLGELGARPWRRRARIAIAAVALASIGAASWATWVATNAPATTDELCESAGREIERVWNAERRTEVTATTNANVTRTLDDYATGWSTRRIAVCKLAREATTAADRDQRTAARLACLNGKLTNLDATVSIFTHAPTPALVARAETIVSELPPLVACDGVDTTATVTEAKRDAWQPMLQKLVDGRQAFSEGRIDEAARLATSVVETARAGNEREPLAQALLLLGQTQTRTAARDARTTLLEAVRVATDVREEATAVEAWVNIIELAFTDRQFLDGIEHAILGAELAASRLAQDSPMRTRLAYTTGTVHVMRGDMQAAIPQLASTLGAYRENEAKHRFEIAAVESSLGVAQLYRAELATARAHFERSLATWQSLPSLHPNLVTTTAWLGEVAMWQGDAKAAEEHYTRAVTLAEQLGTTGRAQLGKLLFQLGFFYARTERCAKAIPMFERSASLIAPTSAAQPLLGRGMCARNRKTAIALLRRASSLSDKPASLLQRPFIELALARALHADRKTRGRAAKLAESARDAFARFPLTHAERDAAAALAPRPRT